MRSVSLALRCAVAEVELREVAIKVLAADLVVRSVE